MREEPNERDELERRVGEWLDAAQSGDRARRDRAFAALDPMLRVRLRRHCRHYASLITSARLTVDDVIQETLLLLHARPPTGLEQAPTATLVRWCQTVAVRHCISRARLKDSVARSLEGKVETGWEPVGERWHDPVAREAFEAALRRCAEALEGRYAKTWDLLIASPDLSALELAVALGLLGERDARDSVAEAKRDRGETEPRDVGNEAEEDRRKEARERLRLAKQNAWAAKSLTLKRLGKCLRDCGQTELPEEFR